MCLQRVVEVTGQQEGHQQLRLQTARLQTHRHAGRPVQTDQEGPALPHSVTECIEDDDEFEWDEVRTNKEGCRGVRMVWRGTPITVGGEG